MGTENCLLDAWKITGTNYDEFIQEYTLLRHRTGYTQMRSSGDVMYTSLYRDTEGIHGKVMSYDMIESLNKGTLDELRRVNFDISDPIIRSLLNECLSSNKLLIMVPRWESVPKNIFLSEHCKNALLQIAKISGWAAFNNNNLLKNLFLSNTLLTSSPYTYIYRSLGGITKIFGIFTSRRAPRMLANIPEIIEKSGLQKYLRFRSYSITNLKTSVAFDLPVYPSGEGLMPGFIISDSDTGMIPFTVQCVLFTEDQDYSIIEERKLESKRALRTEDYIMLLKNCIDPDVYALYLKEINALPERLSIPKELLVSYCSDVTARRFATFTKHGIVDGKKNDVVLSLFNMPSIFKREKLCMDDGSLTRIRREIPALLLDLARGELRD